MSKIAKLPVQDKATKAKPKARKRTRRSKTASVGVARQVRESLRKENALATLVGFLLGGFVPLASYMVVHNQITSAPLYTQPLMLIVLGGLVFSAKTVYEWTHKAFESKPKALGFVILAEGIMTLSTQEWLSISALVYLVAVNGFGTGVSLALQDRRKR